MENTSQGVVRGIADEGTVVLLLIEAADGQIVALIADGNMFRRARASIGKPLVGQRIEYGLTDWPGGLEWFAIIEDGYIVCPRCHRHIGPHLDPDACFDGLHRRKHLPANGVHR